MGKATPDAVLDAMADKIIAECDLMTLCSAEPTTLTEAVTTFALADVAMSGVDFTKANGDVSGRKVTVAAKGGVTVDTTGTATHVALVDSGTNLLYVTTCTSQGVSSGGTADIAAWDIEIADPA